MMLGKVTPFVHNTYKIVSESKTDDIISWNQSGDAFIIKDQYSFQSEVLPRYFKHNNLSSFIRQLNTYQFHKIPGDNINYGNPEHIIFSHPQFLKQREDLLPNIVRRQTRRSSVTITDDTQPPSSPMDSPSMLGSIDPNSFSPEQMALQVIQMRKRLDETNNILHSVHNDLIRTKDVLHQLQSNPHTQNNRSNRNYSNFSNYEVYNRPIIPSNTANAETYVPWFGYSQENQNQNQNQSQSQNSFDNSRNEENREYNFDEEEDEFYE